MNTDSLRHLIALAETGSYSEAAAISGVTQPAVSLTVKKMEGDLGVKLFERSGSRYVATPAGRVFLEHAGEILDAEERLMASIEKTAVASSGRLTIATSNIPGEYVLPLVLGGFRTEHPDIEPVLEVMDSAKVVEAVRSGSFEIGFTGSRMEPEGLAMVPFCPDSLEVICPPGHPLAGKRSVQPGALAGEKFLLREEGSGTRELMVEALGEAGLDVGRLLVEMELGSTGAVISAVASGAGISLVSAWAAAGPLAEGRVERINVPRLKASRQFKMVWMKRRKTSALAGIFAEFVKGKRAYLERQAKKIGR